MYCDEAAEGRGRFGSPPTRRTQSPCARRWRRPWAADCGGRDSAGRDEREYIHNLTQAFPDLDVTYVTAPDASDGSIDAIHRRLRIALRDIEDFLRQTSASVAWEYVARIRRKEFERSPRKRRLHLDQLIFLDQLIL